MREGVVHVASWCISYMKIMGLPNYFLTVSEEAGYKEEKACLRLFLGSMDSEAIRLTNIVLPYGHVVKLTSKYLIYTHYTIILALQPSLGNPCSDMMQQCRDL